ncbi:MAG: ATP-dependent helicase [Candidatus Levybacteria bacterium]|nr:ATP-dependent helicase [Candidatus Levybacteria bacterium]
MTAGKLLNAEQREAITFGKGPLLIIAGAGTGKTTVITERIKHLILEKNVAPSEILALTFTDKAAREMEERIDIVMPYGYTQLWINTFHAFCDRILRNEAIHIGLTPNYKLMTEAESVLFLKKHFFSFQLSYFRPLGNPYKFIQGMLQHFARLRDEDIAPIEYMQWAQTQSEKRKAKNEETDESEIKKNLELANAYKTYEELKAKEGVMDFSDLISNALQLFRKRKNILKQYQRQFSYILVDEFQDTNYAQNKLAILLAGDTKNITVVGDDDQAIYRWRGAAISNMIQFKDTFPDAKIVTLTQNYRSTQGILDRSYDLISHNNPDRLEIKENINKKLTSTRKVKSDPVELIYQERVEDEADVAVKQIQELTKKQYQYSDIAILVRANDHAQPFIKALQRNNTPYQFLGPGRLFRQEEIKDLIAYLKVLYNFEDTTAMYRVLNNPLFGIEPRTIAGILNLARRKNLSLFETVERITDEKNDIQEIFIKDVEKEKLKKLIAMIHKHLKRVPHDSAGQILYYFAQDTELLNNFLSAKTASDTKYYQNIAKFFDKLQTFEAEYDDARIFPVVDWIDLSLQMGESPIATDMDWSENNAVNILTIHSSKGLEFPVVFLVNLVSQRFPTRERREQIPIPQELIKEILPEGDYHLQEERRLFYVGMTRAKNRLFLTAANYYGEGKRDRKLSPFVYEALGQNTVEALMKKKKEEKTVIQPSLLDWTQNYAEQTGVQSPSDMVKLVSENGTSFITYVSYSQLQTFDLCPLHYKLQYLLRIPYQPTSALSFGTSVHAALRDFSQLIMQGSVLKPQDVLPLLEKVWIDEGYESKTHKQQAFERAGYVLQKYLSDYPLNTAGRKVAGIEIPFSFFLSSPEIRKSGLKIGGKIDRVDLLSDNRIEIIDYKTGSNVPSEKDLQTNLQLTIYALAATEVQDRLFHKKPEEVTLSLHYLEENTMLTTIRSKEQLEKAKIDLLTKVNEIEKSDFSCSGSIFCQNCEYKMLCSVGV